MSAQDSVGKIDEIPIKNEEDDDSDDNIPTNTHDRTMYERMYIDLIDRGFSPEKARESVAGLLERREQRLQRRRQIELEMCSTSEGRSIYADFFKNNVPILINASRKEGKKNRVVQALMEIKDCTFEEATQLYDNFTLK